MKITASLEYHKLIKMFDIFQNTLKIVVFLSE